MRFLLDTHTVIWAANDDHRLSRRVRAQVFEEDVVVHFSPVSAYEIALKNQAGKFPDAQNLLRDYQRELEGAGWTELPLRSSHSLEAGRLPLVHRDPFDRLLAAQALVEDITFVSRDETVDQFGVRRLW